VKIRKATVAPTPMPALALVDRDLLAVVSAERSEFTSGEFELVSVKVDEGVNDMVQSCDLEVVIVILENVVSEPGVSLELRVGDPIEVVPVVTGKLPSVFKLLADVAMVSVDGIV
jgi:hypothetical protein